MPYVCLSELLEEVFAMSRRIARQQLRSLLESVKASSAAEPKSRKDGENSSADGVGKKRKKRDTSGTIRQAVPRAGKRKIRQKVSAQKGKKIIAQEAKLNTKALIEELRMEKQVLATRKQRFKKCMQELDDHRESAAQQALLAWQKRCKR